MRNERRSPRFWIVPAVLIAGLALAALVRPALHVGRHFSDSVSEAAVGSPVPSAEVVSVLQEIKARDAGQLAVSEEDGRFLRVLLAASGTRRALEIGAASGYSAIWMGLALRETGGRLVTIEYDPERAAEAIENVRRAGLDDVVEVIAGDGFVEIPKLEGEFDFVFLDAWKKDYQAFFDLTFPRLRRGGIFAAHNVLNKGDEMPDFLSTIETHPALWTTIVAPSDEGISLSYRVR
jgi:caffeoyl-CoA O-methyltransferase